jgi:AraC-like DNA-binding protein
MGLPMLNAVNNIIVNCKTIRSSFHTDSSPQTGRGRSMEASCVQAKVLQQAHVQAAILLAAMSALAIFSAPYRVGFSSTRTAAHSLLDRQVHNAHMTIKSEGPAAAGGATRRHREILYCQKSRYSIR